MRILKSKIILFQDKILTWFEVFGRHHFAWRKDGLSAYEIVIAEVLLQRTKAETIEKFYPGFLATFPSWETIAEVDTTFLEQQLQPVGLYRQRAKRLKDLAIEMVRRQGQFPPERAALEQILSLANILLMPSSYKYFINRVPW